MRSRIQVAFVSLDARGVARGSGAAPPPPSYSFVAVPDKMSGLFQLKLLLSSVGEIAGEAAAVVQPIGSIPRKCRRLGMLSWVPSRWKHHDIGPAPYTSTFAAIKIPTNVVTHVVPVPRRG